eukprot:1186728-Pyramimonas_sp.AAC.3
MRVVFYAVYSLFRSAIGLWLPVPCRDWLPQRLASTLGPADISAMCRAEGLPSGRARGAVGWEGETLTASVVAAAAAIAIGLVRRHLLVVGPTGNEPVVNY